MSAYVSVEEADAYHNLRMSAEIWGALTATEKARRLVNASDYIDSGYIYLGKPSDKHQLRAFPRNGDTDVPVKVKNAVCELALEENLTQNPTALKSAVKVGELSVTYSHPSAANGVENQRFSYVAQLLREFVREKGAMRRVLLERG